MATQSGQSTGHDWHSTYRTRWRPDYGQYLGIETIPGSQWSGAPITWGPTAGAGYSWPWSLTHSTYGRRVGQLSLPVWQTTLGWNPYPTIWTVCWTGRLWTRCSWPDAACNIWFRLRAWIGFWTVSWKSRALPCFAAHVVWFRHIWNESFTITQWNAMALEPSTDWYWRKRISSTYWAPCGTCRSKHNRFCFVDADNY